MLKHFNLFLIMVICFMLWERLGYGSLQVGYAQELMDDPEIAQPNSTGHKKSSQHSPPKVLFGGVQTLEAAMEAEADTVDWYGWYLNVRQYLVRTGGLQCTVGTPIHFHRSGQVTAGSPDPFCQMSVLNKSFPLPENTRLDEVILPVRGGPIVPPASRNELLKRIQQQEKNRSTP